MPAESARRVRACCGPDVELVLRRLFCNNCRPDRDGMGDQLLVYLHSVDDDPVTNLNVRFLEWLLAARVGCLCVEADLNGFGGCRLDSDGCVRNLCHSARHVLFAAVRPSYYRKERKRHNRENRDLDLELSGVDAVCVHVVDSHSKTLFLPALPSVRPDSSDSALPFPVLPQP